MFTFYPLNATHQHKSFCQYASEWRAVCIPIEWLLRTGICGGSNKAFFKVLAKDEAKFRRFHSMSRDLFNELVKKLHPLIRKRTQKGIDLFQWKKDYLLITQGRMYL